jgi:hypothetical protein
MTSERIWDWSGWVSRRLIDYAARSAPDALSERLLEEWLADSAGRNRQVSRVRFAMGCVWAARVIAQEHAEPTVSATSPALANNHFIRFPREEFPFFAGSTQTFVLIVSLFAAVLYGLAIALK